MKTLRHLAAAALALLAFWSPISVAGTYKWVDENGSVHFGDRPPGKTDFASVNSSRQVQSVTESRLVGTWAGRDSAMQEHTWLFREDGSVVVKDKSMRTREAVQIEGRFSMVSSRIALDPVRTIKTSAAGKSGAVADNSRLYASILEFSPGSMKIGFQGQTILLSKQ